MHRRHWSGVILAAALLTNAHAQTLEWPSYGNDPGGTRYSPAKIVTAANVATLNRAWEYKTGALERAGKLTGKIAFEATPILVNGALYVSTPLNRVIALDPGTGREKWSFDPNVSNATDYSEVTSRGVAYWAGGKRIFLGTIDARLIAIDAATGVKCADFGQGGEVDLRKGIRVLEAGSYQLTSPPAIVNDLVIVGSAVADNRATDVERGTVRAYDARTGKLRWSWDPLASLPSTGGANAWSIFSSDSKLGLVFVPTGSAGPDFFGGERKGDNRYANSVTALRVATGEVAWSFQVVHHDLWDYDVASQPVLINYGPSKTPAVVVTTKTGLVYVLDRKTGKPLSPVEERPVPKSDIPGEEAWPTQPFPVAIEPLAPSAARAFGKTEADRAWCEEQLKGLRAEGLFTPPSFKGTLVIPGNAGGVAWGGPAYDPRRGLLVVNTNRFATIVRLVPRDQLEAARRETGENRFGFEFGSQRGTPYAMVRAPFITSGRMPCTEPPWGALTALDLTSGKKRWEVPLGSWLGQPSGSPNFGGPLVTAGGVTFIGASADDRFRAFDTETGKVLWETELPAPGVATPMTYVWKGVQYVVISAGGHAKVGTKLADSVIAFRLGKLP
jgi:quinoprotein glucose dehydrogenase